ncbi:hypothetical protein D3C71_1793880 [compost metagenome]
MLRARSRMRLSEHQHRDAGFDQRRHQHLDAFLRALADFHSMIYAGLKRLLRNESHLLVIGLSRRIM